MFLLNFTGKVLPAVWYFLCLVEYPWAGRYNLLAIQKSIAY
jgi:hypothetical protein